MRNLFLTWGHGRLLGTISVALAVAHTILHFLITPDPQCTVYPVLVPTDLRYEDGYSQWAACPFLPSTSHPTAPAFFSLLSLESSGQCRSLCTALSCPKPGADLRGVGKQETQSILWDKGVEMKTGQRAVEGMGNRGGTSQGTRLRWGSCHWGGSFTCLC